MSVVRKINSFKKKAGWQANDLLFASGFKNFLLRVKPGLRILVYHGIDKAGRTDINGRFISAERFEQHLIAYKENFNLVSLNEVYSGNYDKNKFNLCITFDDGYKNNLLYALPLLEKHKIPATFFITTIKQYGYDFLWPDLLDVSSLFMNGPLSIAGMSFTKKRGEFYSAEGLRLKSLAKKKDWNFKEEMIKAIESKVKLKEHTEISDYWKLLNEEDIAKLASSPMVTIGSHGTRHNNLGEIAFTEACDELLNSKKILEKLISKPVDAVAFPDGSYTKQLAEYALSIGYKKQLASNFLFEGKESVWFSDNEKVMKERFTINPYISVKNQLRCILKGKY